VINFLGQLFKFKKYILSSKCIQAKETHETVEVNNPETALPAPADHMEGIMITEVTVIYITYI